MEDNNNNDMFLKYLAELRVNRFNLYDKEAVQKLSLKLVETQSGWLDEEIAAKATPVDGFVSCPDKVFMQYNPAYYKYLQLIPRHFGLTITIPRGVEISDPFIHNFRMHHIENLNTINQFVLSNNWGEILYYEINQSLILGIIKIFPPVTEHAADIVGIMQKRIDAIFMKAFGVKNANWKVSLRNIDVHDDIRVTLQNKRDSLGMCQ